jgi:hypothetical protein
LGDSHLVLVQIVATRLYDFGLSPEELTAERALLSPLIEQLCQRFAVLLGKLVLRTFMEYRMVEVERQGGFDRVIDGARRHRGGASINDGFGEVWLEVFLEFGHRRARTFVALRGIVGQ